MIIKEEVYYCRYGVLVIDENITARTGSAESLQVAATERR